MLGLSLRRKQLRDDAGVGGQLNLQLDRAWEFGGRDDASAVMTHVAVSRSFS